MYRAKVYICNHRYSMWLLSDFLGKLQVFNTKSSFAMEA